LWCTDIAEQPTAGGKVYCFAVLDLVSRQVLGWSIADLVPSDLVADASQKLGAALLSITNCNQARHQGGLPLVGTHVRAE